MTFYILLWGDSVPVLLHQEGLCGRKFENNCLVLRYLVALCPAYARGFDDPEEAEEMAKQIGGIVVTEEEFMRLLK